MRRLFSKKQREYIKILAGNKCKFCGKSLYKDFHADHKIPYSKKGKTVLQNSQALCSRCNIKKSNKICK